MWLEQVVIWLNHEYVWDPDAMVPSCWSSHPHLIHEIAVLGDLRRRAGIALTADALEEWHRYALPAFIDRMRARLRQQCQDGGHQSWPASGRHTRHQGSAERRERSATFRSDVDALGDTIELQQPPAGLRRGGLTIVDGLTVDVQAGEVLD